MTERRDEGSLGIDVPKKLARTVKKLTAAGETLVQIAPAILESKASKEMLAIARMGMMDKVLGYLVTTDKNVHFVRPGFAWDSVQTVPLDVIDDVLYVNEFHNNTLKIKVGGRAESIIFYEDMNGIWFYNYIKSIKSCSGR